MATLQMTFTNYSKNDWQLDYTDWQFNVFSGFQQQPGPVLNAMDGQQTMSCNQDEVTWIAQGVDLIACCWRDPSGLRIGVKMHLHAQVFGMGPRPSWAIMIDGGRPAMSTPNWGGDFKDPSTPYSWSGIPYSIVATPVSQHTELAIQIIMGDIHA